MNSVRKDEFDKHTTSADATADIKPPVTTFNSSAVKSLLVNAQLAAPFPFLFYKREMQMYFIPHSHSTSNPSTLGMRGEVLC